MLIWLLGMAFANNLCSVDYYNPPIQIFSQYQCLEEDLRSPASIEKLKPQLSASKDGMNPKWTAQQRRIYRMLRSKRFNGFDANGDGTSDISITKLQGGGQKITFANRGDGKITQISVFDTYGKLISERIDTDMDGHVDQVYECKDQVCERKFDVVNGKPQRLVRTIASGADEIIEVYEDKNGQMQLVKKSTHPRIGMEFSSDGSTEGGITGCTEDCYDKNYSRFTELLDQFKSLQQEPRVNLPKVDDFYLSRVGVLIHEECFKKYEGQFDVEKAITDAVVKGMSCQIDLAKASQAEYGTKGATFYSHMPRLVNLFNNSSRLEEGAIVNLNGKDQIWKNPCQDYKKLPISKDMDVKKDCSYIPEAELGRPKILCQNDQLAIANAKSHNVDYLANASADGYATGPQNKAPSFVNWKGKTKVYNYPVISFIPNARKQTEYEFKSTFWHELMHNCGYAHKDEGTPDYAFFCETACFGDEYPRGSFDSGPVNLITESKAQCLAPEKDDASYASLQDLLRTLRGLSE